MTTATNNISFKEKQLRFERVYAAYTEKETIIHGLFKAKKIDLKNLRIFLRTLKKEQKLELWAKNKNAATFQLIKIYDFCNVSGTLGPKREQGDNQTPEGLYHIEQFNPASTYYLSLGINYPNKADRILSGERNPGGDIFIHGKCVTIGCIPITDFWIKELYIIAVEACNSGQKDIPVYIYPSKLDDAHFKSLVTDSKPSKSTLKLWKELKQAYDYFETNHKIPSFTIDAKGSYVVGS
jgi:murein L,D-transpeptidase YafK